MANSKNKKRTVLVTAGPTRAYLDRVRYLSNYSSGWLGYYICKALEQHFRVVAVVGPCEAPFKDLEATTVIPVETVDEMYRTVMKVCSVHRPHFAVLAAAVLDFAPKERKSGKVSSKSSWKVELKPTPKIIDELTLKFPSVRKIAFKLEWNKTSLVKLKKFAMANMRDKSADALCLNFLSQIKLKNHPAFLFSRDGKYKKVNTKKEIANWIKNFILTNE